MLKVYRVSRGSFEDGMGDYLIGFFLDKERAYAEAKSLKYSYGLPENGYSHARVDEYSLNTEVLGND